VVFDRLRAFARERNPGIYAALDGGHLLSRDDGQLRIGLPAGFAARRLRDKSDILAGLASEFFGATMRAEVVEESDAGQDAAAGTNADERSEAMRRRRQQALNDAGVARALDVLDGEIVEIRPLGGAR
jgi:hypothetical protein